MASHRNVPPRASPAFTLLELLAVIAIISLLTGLVIGVGRRAFESGRAVRAKAELAALSGALEVYRRTYGDYPQTNDSARLLQSLLGRYDPSDAIITTGRTVIETNRFTTVDGTDPAVNPGAQLADPWGWAYLYVYKTPSTGWTNPGFVLYSAGPDGSDSPALLTGGFVDPAPQSNTDNLYAGRN